MPQIRSRQGALQSQKPSARKAEPLTIVVAANWDGAVCRALGYCLTFIEIEASSLDIFSFSVHWYAMKADREPDKTPSPIKCGNSILRFDRPYLMGIVNTTPDSFSDGGRFLDPNQAIDHALHMAQAGCDLIDIGGESTRPGSDSVSCEEELRRVIPVIEKLRDWVTLPISIDTSKAQVARIAIEAGASLINDISSGVDPEMFRVAAQSQVPLVLMHMRGIPKTMQRGQIHYDHLLDEIVQYLQKATQEAVQAGVRRESIIWDPGLGFGKTVLHNLAILNRLNELCGLGHAVLVGSSRKSFIGKVLDVETDQRLMGTAATVAVSVFQGANIIRVHDVAQMDQVVRMTHAIKTENATAK